MFIRPNTLKGMFRFLEVINRMLRNQTVKRYRINTVLYRDPDHYRQGRCYVVWAPQFFPCRNTRPELKISFAVKFVLPFWLSCLIPSGRSASFRSTDLKSCLNDFSLHPLVTIDP